MISREIDHVRVAAMPYVGEALNHTMNIMRNADTTTSGLVGTLDDVSHVTQAAVPAMEKALNQTSAMVTRLERLVAHPVLQVRLGTDESG